MLHVVEVTLFYYFIFFKFSFSMVINEKSISSISLCCLTCPLMVSWSLYSLWAVSADRVSLLSAFELLAVLTGPGSPLFVLDSGFVGEDWVGRELACRNCVRGCVGLFRVHSYCTHMHRERLYGITTSLLAREAASACLSSSETELTGLREERHPSFLFFFLKASH